MSKMHNHQSNEPERRKDFLIQATSVALLIVINGVTWSLVAYYLIHGRGP